MNNRTNHVMLSESEVSKAICLAPDGLWMLPPSFHSGPTAPFRSAWHTLIACPQTCG